MEVRNCGNYLDLSEDATAVTQYGYDIIYEHKAKGAKKVIGLGDIRLYECPLSYITPDIWEIIRLVYLIEDSNRLLHQGEWGAQPYWLVEAISIYKSEIARRMRKEEHGRKKN